MTATGPETFEDWYQREGYIIGDEWADGSGRVACLGPTITGFEIVLGTREWVTDRYQYTDIARAVSALSTWDFTTELNGWVRHWNADATLYRRREYERPRATRPGMGIRMTPTIGQVRRALHELVPYREEPNGFEWQTVDTEAVLGAWGDVKAMADALEDTAYAGPYKDGHQFTGLDVARSLLNKHTQESNT
jgi:hypothetical protein